LTALVSTSILVKNVRRRATFSHAEAWTNKCSRVVDVTVIVMLVIKYSFID